MEEYSNEGLEIMIKNLTKTVKDGFQRTDNNFIETHKRQDKTNGKVQKNSDFRNKAIGALIIMNVIGIPVVLHYVFTNFL